MDTMEGKIYQVMRIADTESFEDDVLYKIFCSDLKIKVDSLSDRQKNALRATIMHKLGELRNQDKKKIFENIGTCCDAK